MRILVLCLVLFLACQHDPSVKKKAAAAETTVPAPPAKEKDNTNYPLLFVNAEQESLDFYNEREQAILASKSSEKMTARSFIVALIGPPESGVTRSIYNSESKNLEVVSGEKVIIVRDENIPDDSIESEIRFFTLRKPEKSWQLLSVSSVWKCHQGLGHQEFSIAACN